MHSSNKCLLSTYTYQEKKRLSPPYPYFCMKFSISVCLVWSFHFILFTILLINTKTSLSFPHLIDLLLEGPIIIKRERRSNWRWLGFSEWSLVVCQCSVSAHTCWAAFWRPSSTVLIFISYPTVHQHISCQGGLYNLLPWRSLKIELNTHLSGIILMQSRWLEGIG